MKNETFRTWWTLFMQRWNRAEHRELAALYWSELKHLSDDGFARAARQALRDCDFFPRFGLLIEWAGEGGETAIEAWESVLPLLRNSRSSLDSLSENAQRTVRLMGGLSRIGASEQDLPHRRREFMEYYLEVATSSVSGDMPELTDEGRDLMRKALAETRRG